MRRLPYYLSYLKKIKATGKGDSYISATALATDLKLYDVLVRKDFAFVSRVSGKPRIGFKVEELINDIEHFLGCDIEDKAVLVGAGHLGQALLSYKGFEGYGLEIIAAFDSDNILSGREINGKTIFHISMLDDLCRRLNARIGIITTPADVAQEVCDRLVKSGVAAIWNFAPIQLNVRDDILVQNENMAGSLAILSNRLKRRGESR
jgi:redox-sensing transcriptional repressor